MYRKYILFVCSNRLCRHTAECIVLLIGCEYDYTAKCCLYIPLAVGELKVTALVRACEVSPAAPVGCGRGEINQAPL